jgi:hypothetical protein
MPKRKRCEEVDRNSKRRDDTIVPVYYFGKTYLPTEIWRMIRTFLNFEWRKYVIKSEDGMLIRRYGGDTAAIDTYVLSLVNKQLYGVVGKSYIVRYTDNLFTKYCVIKFENIKDTEFGVHLMQNLSIL